MADHPRVGFNADEGKIQIEIAGLTEPKSDKAKRIISEDLSELVAAVVQDKETIAHGVFDGEMREMGQEITQIQVGKIVRERHPDLDESDQEAIRQRVVAAMVFVQEAKRSIVKESSSEGYQAERLNTAIVDGVRRFAMSVKELDIDLIDSINPFGEAYAILSHAMTPERFAEIQAIIEKKRIAITSEEAKMLAVRASMFKKDRDRFPSATSPDAWERRMAEGAAAFLRFKKDGLYDR